VKYKAGPSWNLDGPASDAIRFLEYMHRRGVPKNNSRTYLEPVLENAALIDRAKELSATVAFPIQSVLDDLVENILPPLRTGLLIFYWAGHGVIMLDDTRRLLTSDATAESKRNVDLLISH
jgi:hypothetical protein